MASFDATTESVKGITDNALLQAKAVQAMTEKAADSDVKANLKAAVKAMTGKAVKISQEFETVRLKLLFADSKNYEDKNGKVVPKLAPGWQDLQERFDTLLQTSQDIASVSVAYINDYINTIVPMMNDKRYTVEDRKNELRVFIGKAEGGDGEDPTHKKAVDMKTKFTKLSRDVAAFGINFIEYAKQQKGAWDDKIEVLKTEIKTLELEIKVYDGQIMALGIALGVGVHVVAAGACGALLAFGPFGPAVAGVIVLAGIIAAGVDIGYMVDAIKKRNAAESSKTSKNKTIEELKASKDELESIQAGLATSKVVVDDIAAGILGFADLWTVAGDAKELSAAVEYGISAPSAPGLEDRVKLTVAGYTTLAEALKDYSVMITDEKKKIQASANK